MDNLLIVVILGVVEGITEFLPVSSTGHLILVASLLGFTEAGADIFEVFIQLGAILAVVLLYPRRFLNFLDARNAQPGFSGITGLKKLGLACLPALLLGAVFHRYIKQELFKPFPVALALILGGFVLLLVERRKSRQQLDTLDQISYRTCFLVGLFQCLALWPGISRSGSTIVGGMLLGLPRLLAAEFSFLVAVPIMSAAVAYDLYKGLHLLQQEHILPFAVGFLVALVSALIGVKGFVSLLGRFDLAVFGYYRIMLGILVLALL
jgi:undecaprenyl-diphosphatase